jgi:hypothetical protein
MSVIGELFTMTFKCLNIRYLNWDDTNKVFHTGLHVRKTIVPFVHTQYRLWNADLAMGKAERGTMSTTLQPHLADLNKRKLN